MLRASLFGSSRALLISLSIAGAVVATTHDASAQTAGGTAPATSSTDKSNGKGTDDAKGKPAVKPATDTTQATATTPTPGDASTTAAGKKSDDAKEDTTKGEHRKRAVYVSFDLGFTRPDLGGFSNSLGFDRTAANGWTYALGAGLRLGDVRFGAKWRVYDTTQFDLWGFMGEIGYSLPTRPFSPGILGHVGYVRDQSLETSLYRNSLPPGAPSSFQPDVKVRGVVLGGELQAMYWISAFLRAGAYLGFDAFLLSRPRAGSPPSLFPVPDETLAKPLYSESGSSVGYALSIGARGAFDIGF